jgi:hypothetical protein
MPGAQELPSTLQRSPREAQETWIKAHDSAVESYGEGERAHRTAFSALKHSFEKVGDHWEPKQRRGPSDAQARGGRDTRRPTAGGVDAEASLTHLRDVARRLEIRGRSRMSRQELVDAIDHENRRRTARSRQDRSG